MIEMTNLTDHFLIAMPTLGDPNFFRTVTYMCQHNDEGALGIIINRATDMTLSDILEQMKIETDDEATLDLPIYYGGPVQSDRGFVIHEPVGDWNSSFQVTESVALTTSRDILEAIAAGEGPKKVLIALGYAGWGEGQLEQEIVENAWLNVPAKMEILFDIPPSQRWRSAASEVGVDLDLLSSQAGHG